MTATEEMKITRSIYICHLSLSILNIYDLDTTNVNWITYDDELFAAAETVTYDHGADCSCPLSYSVRDNW